MLEGSTFLLVWSIFRGELLHFPGTYLNSRKILRSHRSKWTIFSRGNTNHAGFRLQVLRDIPVSLQDQLWGSSWHHQLLSHRMVRFWFLGGVVEIIEFRISDKIYHIWYKRSIFCQLGGFFVVDKLTGMMFNYGLDRDRCEGVTNWVW